MNNYKLINERWQSYVKEENLEEQFNRELNKLLKELQVLREANEPGMMGKIGQKIGQFVKSSLDKIASAIKNAPKTAISLVTKLIGAAKIFLKDPNNKRRLLSAVKAVGVLALLAAALYSPDVQAAIIDPETGKTIGPGGSEVLANAIRGSLGLIADGLDNIIRTDIDPRAMELKSDVIGLINKINSPQAVEMNSLERYILKIAKTAMQIVREADKDLGGDNLTKQLVGYGNSFQDFLITKMQGITTEYTGKLPGTGKGPSFGDLGVDAARAMLKE